jgi:hypothetical protein
MPLVADIRILAIGAVLHPDHDVAYEYRWPLVTRET